MDDRFHALGAWLAESLGAEPFRIERASTDASFRRYFRVFLESGTLIAMDAPPERENSRAFVHVAGLLRAAGLHPLDIAMSAHISVAGAEIGYPIRVPSSEAVEARTLLEAPSVEDDDSEGT